MRLALATALHHSAQRVEAPREVEEHETPVGLRAQQTPPRGTQPAALREPGLQVVVVHAARPCSSGVPPLPALGGDCSLDDVAVQFLVAHALLEKEQKALALEEEEELVAELARRELERHRASYKDANHLFHNKTYSSTLCLETEARTLDDHENCLCAMKKMTSEEEDVTSEASSSSFSSPRRRGG